MNDDQQKIQQRAFDVERAGVERYGDDFRQCVAALAARKVDPETVTRAMFQPDAIDCIMQMGRHAVIDLADDHQEWANVHGGWRAKERAAPSEVCC